MTMPKVNVRNALLLGIGVTVLLLVYSWWSTRRQVLDASNSQKLSSLFDQLNPTIPGTAS
jgi:hypothetical protein